MNTTVYSTHKFEEHYLIQANNNKHQLILLDVRLTEETAVLAKGHWRRKYRIAFGWF